MTDNTLKKITQDVLARYSFIVSDHDVHGVGRTFSKFGRTMSGDRLLFPALLCEHEGDNDATSELYLINYLYVCFILHGFRTELKFQRGNFLIHHAPQALKLLLSLDLPLLCVDPCLIGCF